MRTKNYEEAEQRYKGDVEGEQSTGDTDKPLFRDTEARHVPGGTWVAQVCARIRGSTTALFKNRDKEARNNNERGGERGSTIKEEGTTMR
ncbi:hypothetical protein NDU88_005321 [Pleurodeles waltl]|uniref:Uncharacterized protein n=1 Tax=Pleurodeles waltl TaxID=8319 RepID=A0AAV7WXY6_PLEWA|nr:hypothetical protein NDU88_005321 [Pleurodeles waltl]